MKKCIWSLTGILLCCAATAQLKFTHTYGGGYYDEARAVLQVADSGYYLAGATGSYGAQISDMLIVKTDKTGNEEWVKLVGGPNIDKAFAMKYHQEGGLILAGITDSYGAGGFDAYIVKTDLNGDTLWTRTYGGSDWDMAYSVDTTWDGNYVVAGETFSFGAGGSDGFVSKIASSGDTLWTRVLGGPQDDVIKYVIEARDSFILAIGSTKSAGAGGWDVWVVKLDQNGNVVREQTYGTAEDEFGYSIDDYFDGADQQFYMIGTAFYAVESGLMKPRLMRIRDTLDVVTDIPYQGLSNNQDEDLTIVKRRRNYGHFFYATVRHQFSDDGDNYNIKMLRSEGGGYYGIDNLVVNPANQIPYDFIETYDGGIAVVGVTDYFGPGTNAAILVKADSNLQIASNVVVSVEEQLPDGSFAWGPNPFTEYIHIMPGKDIVYPCQLKMMDAAGRLVREEILYDPSQVTLDVYGLESGMYFLHFITPEGRYTAKAIKSY